MNLSDTDLREQGAVLKALEPRVEALMERHLEQRNLWLPADLLDPEEATELRERAGDLSAGVRAGLALNLLTEEGLPHFHRLLATYLGRDSVWRRWSDIWTAEEDRHGCVLRDYARDAGVFDMQALERMQYEYLVAGFDPEWGRDPYQLLAYTTLQERATQFAHANLARLAARTEPRLQRTLGHVAADESRHHAFYRDAFSLIIEEDPERALRAAWAVMPRLAMPGHTMPDFTRLADVARVEGIYGPFDYRRIVAEMLRWWGIPALRGLSGAGEHIRERLLELPERLGRVAERMSERRPSVSMQFDFLPRAVRAGS